MNEKPFTADEIFNACALIIERKIFRRTPESVAVNQRRERKMLLAGTEKPTCYSGYSGYIYFCHDYIVVI